MTRSNLSSIVTFDHVSFSYPDRSVLRESSFELCEREMIGVIGPNGGGKTTTLELMMGFLRPSQGKVRLFGQEPHRGRIRIGYVPQSPHYDPQFPISAGEVVLTGSLRKARWGICSPKRLKRHAEEVLERLNLSASLLNQAFGSLSGGQRQAILLARALIGDPDLLLLDEPTANLDPGKEEETFQYLHQLQTTKTVVVVSHNFEMITRYSDRILCCNSQVSLLSPQEVCSHVGVGLYHSTPDKGE